MKSGFQRAALIAGILVLTCSLHFGAAILGAPAALVVAALLGVGITLLWLQFELPATSAWIPPATSAWIPPAAITAAVLLSTTLLELTFRWDFAAWFAPLLTLLASGITMAVLLRNRTRCNLCHRGLSTSDLTFRCPRCSQQVCEQTCWSFEHRRCELCLEQRVPMLTPDSTWWTRVAGPALTQGRCQVCQAGPDQADLHACPKCRRPQCRNCWDFANGECARCAATLPDLPIALRSVIGSGLHPQDADNHTFR